MASCGGTQRLIKPGLGCLRACQRADRFLLRVSRNRRGFFSWGASELEDPLLPPKEREREKKKTEDPGRADRWWVDRPVGRSVAGDLNHLRRKSCLIRTSSRISLLPLLPPLIRKSQSRINLGLTLISTRSRWRRRRTRKKYLADELDLRYRM